MKVGVVLSGCGVYDGSEVQEAVLALLALDRLGATAVCMAPNIEQESVVNHRTGKLEEATRNVLDEGARIARGKIQDVAKVKAADLDALILPGGFGATKNLCNFATAGSRAKVEPNVARLLREMHKARKPIAALCIAPALVAAALRDDRAHPKLTVGSDEKTAKALEEMGARHIVCPVEEFRVDEEQRIVSSPAYMYDARISEVAVGIERAVKELVRLAG
ncbi:MAG TPA: isoprenoid biosynthesis glyoxalase ElbB [Planctomycetota bacterium]|jgi:enhancing lycopene biosynthesis protein 2|nr:isoprenoid biosynthesis glyoxalase ElbB [Planctomycetota bacterium]